MKKVAVCGYTSNIADYFIRKYRDKYDFVLLGRHSESDIYLDLEIQSISGNTELLSGCDALVNFVAQTDVQDDEKILKLMKVNVLGSLCLAMLANRFQIPLFINLSSISATYDANDPYYGYYSQSKKCADELLSCYCSQNNINLCILQPTAVFGSSEFETHQPLLYGLIKKVKVNQDIEIYGSVDAKRNYIHVDTLAEVIDKALQKQINGTYPVLNGKNDSITEIIQCLNEYYGSNCRYIFRKDQPDIIERNFEKQDAIYKKLDIPTPNGFATELKKTISYI